MKIRDPKRTILVVVRQVGLREAWVVDQCRRLLSDIKVVFVQSVPAGDAARDVLSLSARGSPTELLHRLLQEMTSEVHDAAPVVAEEARLGVPRLADSPGERVLGPIPSSR